MAVRGKVLLVGLFVCCLGVVFSCRGGVLDSVLMPNANMIAKINFAKIQQSPIVKLIKKYDTVGVKSKSDEVDAILKKYGISQQDIKEFVLGSCIVPDSVSNAKKALKAAVKQKFVIGLQMTKAITLEKLKSLLLALVKQQSKVKLDVKLQEKDGIKYLQIKDLNSKDKAPIIAVTFLAKEKILIGGFTLPVMAAVKRVKAHKKVAFSKEMAKLKSAVSKDADLYAISYLPESQWKKFGFGSQTEAAKPKAGKEENNAFNFAALEDIDSITFDAKLNKSLHVDLLTHFVNRKSAVDTQKMLNQLLPLLKFQAMIFAKGVPLPMINSIAINLAKTHPEVNLSFTFTEQDIKGINKIIEQNSKQNQKRINKT